MSHLQMGQAVRRGAGSENGLQQIFNVPGVGTARWVAVDMFVGDDWRLLRVAYKIPSNLQYKHSKTKKHVTSTK